MTKALITALLLLVIVFIVAHLEYRFAPTEQAVRDDPPRMSTLGYPCETWVRQTGGGKPIFACVKANK